MADAVGRHQPLQLLRPIQGSCCYWLATHHVCALAACQLRQHLADVKALPGSVLLAHTPAERAQQHRQNRSCFQNRVLGCGTAASSRVAVAGNSSRPQHPPSHLLARHTALLHLNPLPKPSCHTMSPLATPRNVSMYASTYLRTRGHTEAVAGAPGRQARSQSRCFATSVVHVWQR